MQKLYDYAVLKNSKYIALFRMQTLEGSANGVNGVKWLDMNNHTKIALPESTIAIIVHYRRISNTFGGLPRKS